MSPAFHPYREWLGVISHGETPNYYELLGLRPLEPEVGKIDLAYQRQSARLIAQFSGGHADLAQRLMGELAEARMTLLTPTAKRAYDEALANGGANGAGSPSVAPQPMGHQATAPQPAVPQPAVPQPVAPQAVAVPQYGPAQAVGQTMPGYAGYAPAYHAVQGYAAAPAYPMTQPHPGWQGQVAAPVAVQNAPVPTYYAAPAMGSAAPNANDHVAPSIPSIRRRVRRRTSPVPALAGAAVIVVAVAGGMWFHFKGSDTVAVATPDRERTNPSSHRQAASQVEKGSPKSAEIRPPKRNSSDRPSDRVRAPNKAPVAPPKVTPDLKPMPRVDEGASASAPADENGMAGMAKPTDKPAIPHPQPDSPGPKPAESPKPQPASPAETPKADRKAGAEELATVGKLLKSARAALASRNIVQARDLLAEATIEATAPDTTAEVNRVELLASYVEMFWDAVRQTLPKIGLEELEINGTRMSVVEADADHLVIRTAGKNREYTWQKLPKEIAHYLADRWLAPDDPVRNLVLASFEIVDPKGDRSAAESLLKAAQAADLNAQPLREELQASARR
ncbi:MAG TPA: hypothetical protein VHC22_04260 [Pirellulales bacterium]|nr:hypothetical protein [Pirellulales bacterium]